MDYYSHDDINDSFSLGVGHGVGHGVGRGFGHGVGHVFGHGVGHEFGHGFGHVFGHEFGHEFEGLNFTFNLKLLKPTKKVFIRLPSTSTPTLWNNSINWRKNVLKLNKSNISISSSSR